MGNLGLKISFTGHRGDKLSLRSSKHGYDINSKENTKLKELIVKKLVGYITERNKGVNKVYIYTGAALGTDQVAFEAVETLKEVLKDKNIKIYNILCIPHPDFNNHWTSESKDVHERHCKEADEVVYVNEVSGYASNNLMSSYQLRNQYMINNGNDLLIAIFDGVSMSGGTYNAIQYAQKVYVPIEYISLEYLNEFTKKAKESYFK